jgi:maltose O-acetyltransferase
LPPMTSFDRWRTALLRLAGVIIEGRVIVWSPIEIRPAGSAPCIRIGNGTFINSGVRLACRNPGRIYIGKNVLIGPRVQFESVSHGLEYHHDKGRSCLVKDIFVGDRVWIGAGSIILQGISIGQDAVVAAGAVVNRDVPPRMLVAGVPARIVKEIQLY